MADQGACGGSNLSEMLNMSADMTSPSECDSCGSREVKIEPRVESSNMPIQLVTDSNNSNNLSLLNQSWADMIESEVNRPTGDTTNESDSMGRTTITSRPNINIIGSEHEMEQNKGSSVNIDDLSITEPILENIKIKDKKGPTTRSI